ncbi:monoheme cytochrome C [Fulvivirga lutimaris]|uniref:monoheme cytochrome C n=1 Tax=Fulvivirga lutimaris TaxID=1819566 RepID=UPI0012BD43B7|nr:monoheme cytochrome C [Fulvivirga lutimaris]MTI37982.1 monoheme cytochrome C [Fulvivirga lutimaris]
MSEKEKLTSLVKIIYQLTVLALVLVIAFGSFLIYYKVDPSLSALRPEQQQVAVATPNVDDNKIENGIHIRTGLVEAEGLMTVVNNCTNCHSSKLIIQNRMNAERWNATIKWMQETQNLWDLGENQEVIVNYLVTNYPPKKKGRRENLSNIEWYELED